MLVVGYVTRAMVIKALTKVCANLNDIALESVTLKPETLNPKSETLNPKSETLNLAGAHAAGAGRQLQVKSCLRVLGFGFRV